MTVSSKIRIYDLAKELKLDTKRLIEEVRREGVDVSVPSNSVSKELAEKIRNKYFPKKETAVKRGVRVVKRAERVVEEPPAEEADEVAAEAAPAAEAVTEAPQPEVDTPTPAPDAAKPATTAKLLRKLAPAARAEQPAGDQARKQPRRSSQQLKLKIRMAMWRVCDGGRTDAAPPASASPEGAPAPPSRQVRVLRPTAAALNAGVRPGERAPSPVIAPPVTPRDRAERADARARTYAPRQD